MCVFVCVTGGVLVVFYLCRLFVAFYFCVFFFEKRRRVLLAGCLYLFPFLFALNAVLHGWVNAAAPNPSALLPASNVITVSTVMNFIDLPHHRNATVVVSQMLRLFLFSTVIHKNDKSISHENGVHANNFHLVG